MYVTAVVIAFPSIINILPKYEQFILVSYV